MRIMGLDVGDKTIGVAVSDALGLTAQGLEVIRRTGDTGRDMVRLKQIAGEFGVTKIIVGLPRNMNGTVGPQGQKVLQFVDELEKTLHLPVSTWDERLSTVEAEKILISTDMSRGKRRKIIDQLAASIILQGYLDRHPARKRE